MTSRKVLEHRHLVSVGQDIDLLGYWSDRYFVLKKKKFKISVFILRVALKEKGDLGEGERVTLQSPGKDALYPGDAGRQHRDTALRILRLKVKQTLKQVNQLCDSN
jgi:hypothetical protein